MTVYVLLYGTQDPDGPVIELYASVDGITERMMELGEYLTSEPNEELGSLIDGWDHEEVFGTDFCGGMQAYREDVHA